MSEHAEPTPPPIIPRAPYQLMPDLAPAEEEALRASIAEHGVMVPIVVDEHGTVIDGHHRQRIAAELGVDCPHTVRAELPEHEKRLQAVVMNMARRQATDAQLVLVGRRIEPDIAERAKENSRANLRQADAPSGAVAPLGRTRDAVAEAVGLGSGDTYERHKKVIEQLEAEPDGPALIEKLLSGEWTMRDATKEVRWRGEAEETRTLGAHSTATERVETEYETVIQIPHSREAAIARLQELARETSDLKWRRAAAVYAFTRDGRLTCEDLAARGFLGLRSSHTVDEYRRAWQEAIDKGDAVEVGPGEVVTLPTRGFPERGFPEVARPSRRGRGSPSQGTPRTAPSRATRRGG